MSEPAGPSPQMGAVDHLMHRGEANPRTRSGVMLVEILDRTPGWTRLLDTFQRASRVVPRLRQKAVVPSLPTASPRWVIDPDFDLLYHLRRVRAPEPGDLRTVLDMAEVIVSSPLDVGRPLWTVTLVEDLADGQSALLSHFSHAVTDGVGGVEMFMHLYDSERNPALEPMPPLPVPEDLTATDLTRSGIYHLPQNLIGGVVGAVTGATRVAANLVRDPITTVAGAVDYARSSTRVMGTPAEQSPLLRRRGLSRRIEVLDIPLDRLRAAAKAGDASMNDAYLSALCGALRMYHEALGVPVRRAADGDPGEPAHHRRPGRRQPVHGRDAFGPGRRTRSHGADGESAQTGSHQRDEPAVDAHQHRLRRCCQLPAPADRRRGHRVGHARRRAGQQRARLRRGDLTSPGRRC